MAFKSYDTNALGQFRTADCDSDEDSNSVAFDSVSVHSDPCEKRVRFAKREVLLEPLYNSQCFPFLSSKEPWSGRYWSARYMQRLWRERYRECPCSSCQEQLDFWFHLGYWWGGDTRWCLTYFEETFLWKWNLFTGDPLFNGEPVVIPAAA